MEKRPGTVRSQFALTPLRLRRRGAVDQCLFLRIQSIARDRRDNFFGFLGSIRTKKRRGIDRAPARQCLFPIDGNRTIELGEGGGGIVLAKIPKREGDAIRQPVRVLVGQFFCGGEVFVHGRGSTPDWTWGCIALDDADIEELYPLVPMKTRITIYP